MAASVRQIGEDTGHWQTLKLTYPDGFTIEAVFDRPTVSRIKNGDVDLLYSIRKNYVSSSTDGESTSSSTGCSGETGTLLLPSCQGYQESQSLETCVEDDVENDSQTFGDSGTVFKHDHNLFIIEKYSQMKSKFEDPKVKKKCLWENVTDDLNSTFNTSFTKDQVEGRWKSLLVRYRRVKTANKKSGNGRKEFLYEEKLDDILLQRHDISPVALIGSMREQTSQPAMEESSAASAGKKRKSAEKDFENPTEKKLKNKKAASRANNVMNFLDQFAKDMNNRQEQTLQRLEKMHDEKMEIFRGFLEVMKK